VQKYLLRITWLLVTLTIGVASVGVHRFFSFRTSIPKANHPVVADEVAPEAVWRCEATPVLSRPIKVLLDRKFPGWQFPAVSDDDCQSVKEWGGKDAFAQLIQGDFDGDGRLDYAVLIDEESSIDAEGQRTSPDVYVVAFLAKPNEYRMRIVTHEGGGCVQLMKKGDRGYDYDAQREFTYSKDSIFSGWGMGGSSYLYENGKFRAIITSD
jgi:hypothetical protein